MTFDLFIQLRAVQMLTVLSNTSVLVLISTFYSTFSKHTLVLMHLKRVSDYFYFASLHAVFPTSRPISTLMHWTITRRTDDSSVSPSLQIIHNRRKKMKTTREGDPTVEKRHLGDVTSMTGRELDLHFHFYFE